MDVVTDVAKKTANDLKEVRNFFSLADEVYRTFRALHLEDREKRLVQRIVDWVPCSTN